MSVTHQQAVAWHLTDEKRLVYTTGTGSIGKANIEGKDVGILFNVQVLRRFRGKNKAFGLVHKLTKQLRTLPAEEYLLCCKPTLQKIYERHGWAFQDNPQVLISGKPNYITMELKCYKQ